MSVSRLKWMNLQKKTLMIYIAVIFIPFIIAFGIFTYETFNEIEAGNISHMVQICEQIKNNIDTIMSTIDRMSFANTLNSNIEQILEQPEDYSSTKFVDNLKLVNNAMLFASRINPDVLGITFVGKYGQVYSNTRTTVENQEQIKPFLEKAKEQRGKSYISPVYKGNLIGYMEQDIISLSRMLLHSSTFEEIGYVCIDINFKSITDQFDKSVEKKQLSNLIILQDDRFIYKARSDDYFFDMETEKDIIREINRRWNPDMLNQLNVKVGGRNYVFVGIQNKTTGLKIIQCLPMDTIRANAISNIGLFTITLLIVLVATIFTGYFLSSRMSKPVNRLHYAMKKIEEKGQFSTIEGYDNKDDEIGMLIRSFNRMSLRLQDSINKEYVSQLNKRKIEIKMLQFQINPHFLYNTLNVISSIAELNEVPEICTAAGALSDMFRYNIKGKNIVAVKDEIQQIDNYIGIQKLRFPGKISVEYAVDERLMGCLILKFMLQPLVENAVYHGIERKKTKGHIKITASESDGIMAIVIADDGVGMNEEQITELNKNLNIRNEPSAVDDNLGSLGIKNVHYRIQSYYGSDYGLKVAKNENGGLSVHITIPILKGEEEKE